MSVSSWILFGALVGWMASALMGPSIPIRVHQMGPRCSWVHASLARRR